MSATAFQRRRREIEKERIIKELEQREKQLKALKLDELRELAKGKGIEGYGEMKKVELIQALKG